MRTVELTIHLSDDLHEYLIAELSDLDFDAFLQEDGVLRAYIPAARWNDTAREELERWLAVHQVPRSVEERIYEPENWNRRWEETIRPIVVGPFLVKPTWASAPAGGEELILLEIDPKMSFGTGYHESTRLALRLLPGLVRGGERILDAGTGTGILAIAAVKLGASGGVTFDNDEWAIQNAVENFYLNGVADRLAFVPGTMEDIREGDFDLILANIQLNVLVEMMPAFAAKLTPGGRLVLAGLLDRDRERMLAALSEHGLTCVEEARENDWWSAVAVKAGDRAPGS